MKIPVQSKIAELEGRIVKLEVAVLSLSPNPSRPVTVQERRQLDAIWKHFDGMFIEMGKLFR